MSLPFTSFRTLPAAPSVLRQGPLTVARRFKSRHYRLITPNKHLENLPDPSTLPNGYIPGVCGYAPGFVPPKKLWFPPESKKAAKQRKKEAKATGRDPEELKKEKAKTWSAQPPPKKPPMTRVDLEGPSKRQTLQDRPKTSPQILYDRELTRSRYDFRADSLTLSDTRRESEARAVEARRQEARAKREEQRQARADFQAQVSSDPYSAENLLNAQGTTVMKDAPIESTLVKAFSSPEDRKRFFEERAARRLQNKQEVDDARRHQLREQMVALFYNAQTFVTKDNIDAYLQRVFGDSPAANELADLGARTIGSNYHVEQNSEHLVTQRTNELESVMSETDMEGRIGLHVFEEHISRSPTDAQPEA
ncbi:hypothetical protein IWQ60_000124 [Tieghemiomyces parasiticus]|uniref:Uncharacterized protein n=1 Tax=Tieghemiomyces parasiticus TaxID=78921 RepID=A0A9W8DZG6_9FUNG|nr:hypothetical protein IWQ60_000124 [Tieghemiomyces parasiticus]